MIALQIKIHVAVNDPQSGSLGTILLTQALTQKTLLRINFRS